ncbi:MAG: TlpA family protein disulfide reductase [Chlorobiaceae bacterium]|nr:TlpA family protein disulfide reductase [Chlorobiaceae bacterium]
MNIVQRKNCLRPFLAFLFFLGSSGSAYALDKGSKAPDFELPGSNGQVRLSDATGSVVYLDFWASWCGPCRQSFSWMNQMQEKYRSKGLRIIAVNLDAKSEEARKFLALNPGKFTVAFDSKGTTPGQYGVKGMPTSFLVGKNGTILLQHQGFREKDRVTLESEIQKALEGKQ